ncbi:MAG: hypothetical protein KJO79_08655 [Verrucomicrobiae bacterium]|nr:hypothetical protein [Verrucomicrobiae bacterium]NNJ87236.1 hypothetical protein [Akkermansiaceae bacterium]
MNALSKNKKLPAVMLVTVSVACCGIAPYVGASIIWLASNTPEGLTLTTSGTLDIGSTTANDTARWNDASWNINSTSVYGLRSTSWTANGAGTKPATNPWKLGSVAASSWSGDAFGYANEILIWDSSLGSSPGSISPNTTLVFNSLDIAQAFGANLDDGPALLWTHNITGDTISVALAPAPEPPNDLSINMINELNGEVRASLEHHDESTLSSIAVSIWQYSNSLGPEDWTDIPDSEGKLSVTLDPTNLTHQFVRAVYTVNSP